MRITRIKGENIASLAQPFDIDFCKPPLNEVDIFAITGPTGSGKSSLLDAVCLALYDATPRYESSERKSDTGIDISGFEESSTSTKQLLHRGAVEGFAEVSFVVNDTSYTARWELRRARKKATGKLQDVQMSLVNNTTGKIYQGKKTIVKDKIVSIIGLTYNQFVRAVLLAQGDFSAFLSAKDEEKGDILMRITGTEIYKTISQTIFQKTKEKETEYNELVAKYNLSELPSKEEIEQWIQEKEKLTKIIDEKEQHANELEKLLSNLNEYNSILSQLDNAQKQLDEFLPSMEAFPLREEILCKARKINTLLLEKNEINIHEKKIEELHSEQEELQNRKKELEEELIQIDTILQKQQNDLSLLEKDYLENEPLRLEVKQREKKIAEINGEITQIKRHKNEIISQQNDLNNKIEKAKQDIELHTKKLEENNNWLENNKEATENNTYLGTLTTKLQLLQALHTSISNKSEQIEEEQSKLKQKKERVYAINEELEKLNNSLPEDIYNIKQQLKEGDRCPICGNVYHTEIIHKAYIVIEQNVEFITRQRKALKEELENLKEKIPRLQQSIENKENNKKEEENTIKQIIKEESSLYFKITHQKLSQETDFKKASENIQDLSEQIQKVQEERNKEQLQLSNAKSSLSTIEATFNNNNSIINDVKQQITEKQKLITQYKEMIVTLIGVSSLEDYLKQYQQKKDNLTLSIKKIENKKTASATEQKEKTEQIKVIEEEKLPKEEQQKKEKSEAFTLHLSRENIALEELTPKDANWIKEEEETLQNLREKDKAYKAILNERKKDKGQFLEKHSSITSEIDHTPLDLLLQKYNQEIKTNKEQLEEKKELQLNLTLKLREIEKKKEEQQNLETQIISKREEEEKWQRLNRQFGSSDGKKFNIQAQGFTLSSLVEFANLQLQKFAPRYELQRVPKSLALEVIDHEMMEQRRSVHSLSGGETFLVSLALSLALSEISSYSLRIESLFIDEGFGSLDEKTLDAALSALQQLNRYGKKVGIISHVDYITSQLPVRIEVKKSGQGESTVEIVGDIF